MRQHPAASSHSALRTSWPKRTCGRIPKSRAQRRRYAWISGCGEKLRLQSGFGAKEKEYRCDCTSQAQPG
jgi:hypothetical protein